MLNVRDFGAVGDGVTDDAAAFTAAFTASRNGGPVALGRGVFHLATPVTVPARTELVGVGGLPSNYGTTDAATVIAGSLILDGTGIAVRDVLITGGGVTVPTSASNLTIERCSWIITAEALTISGILTHARFVDCHFAYNTSPHVLFVDGCLINSVQFDSCRFEQNGSQSGAFIAATGSARATGSVLWQNCVFEAGPDPAIDAGANVKAWTFLSSHFEQNAGPDIQVGPGTGSVAIIGCNFSYSNGYDGPKVVLAPGTLITATLIGNTVASGTDDLVTDGPTVNEVGTGGS